ncbi:MAG: PorT family protein [Tannerellaceae bacterium]|jgi:opacity protein-like surface antigen|nr:PorT family protein [Tannerellaceae bacterium]
MNQEREKRDEWENIFRRKLQNLEVETSPDDWDAIVDRLQEGKVVPTRRRWTYWAAAVLATLFIGGGVYLSLRTDSYNDTMITEQTRPDTRREVLPSPPTGFVAPESAGNQTLLAVADKQKFRQQATDVYVTPEEEALTTEVIQDTPTEDNDVETGEEIPEDTPTIDPEIQSTTAIPQADVEKPTAPARKWSFGMGMGGLTQNSGEVVNTYVLRSSNNLEDEELLAINAVSDQNMGKLPRTNIKHKMPISFGLSVNRTLNNRFSLQTGLVYSLLISDWETQASAYNNKTRQTLHFLGIPLYLSYKIAEWKRFQIYASTGAQAQLNVDGRLTVRRFSDDLQTGEAHINRRMKELQWSVSAHAGVSYPLFPYVSAFAEMGAAYYFNNGSEVETIYSDKAFNINPQIGLRLNF